MQYGCIGSIEMDRMTRNASDYPNELIVAQLVHLTAAAAAAVTASIADVAAAAAAVAVSG